jgi:uncharacterized protein with von Willebrand factor type A (vWA) domain
MSGDDILRMLDLDGGHDAGQADPLSIESETGAATPGKPAGPPSPTALVLDQWAVRKGSDLRRTIPRLGSTQLGKEPDLAAADFHAAAFLPEPELAERCTDQRRHDFLKAMLETPEYQELHVSTQLQGLPAELATIHFAERFAGLLNEDKAREAKQKPAQPGTKEAARQQMKADLACLRAASQAVQEAQEEVDEVAETANAFGLGPGQPGSADTAAITSIYKRVRNSALIRRICDLAGRFRRVGFSKQRVKASHGYDDMVGVVTGGDVARLLPHELAALDDEDLEMDALRRLAERESLCWEYRGEEAQAKGPLIILTDESASMRKDERLEQSKALALTLAYLARKQKRWCALVGWADEGSRNVLVLPPGRWNENELFAWLEHFYEGGTEPPLEEMAAIYAMTKAPKGKTDMVLITDGVVHLEDRTVAAFNSWKQEAKARLVTLVIASGAGDMRKVSDEIHMVKGLDATSDAVGSVLSI